MDYPILEFDESPAAIIEPGLIVKRVDDIPEQCVLCFFKPVIDAVCANARTVATIRSEIGPNPVYKLQIPDTNHHIVVTHPGVGAPLSGAILEELIAMGCRKFIACGGAGVLNREIAVGHVVIPDQAVRDEGTSYHYLPPSREVTASPEAVAAIQTTLNALDVPYVVGKTWTTDAIYRETRDKVARRRAEGCITVEMEAAAFFAIAQFRGVSFGQILYGGDDVSGDVWDHRDWHKRASTREKLFWLAVDAVQRL
jgi:uridine phosphorylase